MGQHTDFVKSTETHLRSAKYQAFHQLNVGSRPVHLFKEKSRSNSQQTARCQKASPISLRKQLPNFSPYLTNFSMDLSRQRQGKSLFFQRVFSQQLEHPSSVLCCAIIQEWEPLIKNSHRRCQCRSPQSCKPRILQNPMFFAFLRQVQHGCLQPVIICCL